MFVEEQKGIEEFEKGRVSNSTNESNQEERLSSYFEESLKNYRKELFTNNMTSQNKKFNKKAINWIQTQCWAKKMSISTVIQACALYYCYLNNREIEKSSLETLLITCVLLASKFFGGPLSNLKDAIALTSTEYELSVICKLESEILALTNFDIFFPSIVAMVENNSRSPQQCNCLYFCIELLLLKDHDILFNEDKFSQLENIVSGIHMPISCQLSEMMKLPQSEILVNKYRGEFDVDEFMKSL